MVVIRLNGGYLTDSVQCCICGSFVEKKKVKKVEVKEKVKDICDEFVTAISGLM